MAQPRTDTPAWPRNVDCFKGQESKEARLRLNVVWPDNTGRPGAELPPVKAQFSAPQPKPQKDNSKPTTEI